MKKPIADRIRDAWKPNIGYFELMQAVFPHEQYPLAWRYSHNGGPPICAMAFGKALTKLGLTRRGDKISGVPVCDTSSYTPEEWAAYECYVRNATIKGYQPWRWGALNEDVKKRFRAVAKRLVGEWAAGEEEARASREKLARLAIEVGEQAMNDPHCQGPLGRQMKAAGEELLAKIQKHNPAKP